METNHRLFSFALMPKMVIAIFRKLVSVCVILLHCDTLDSSCRRHKACLN